jgi:putative ABC transport system permease protein
MKDLLQDIRYAVRLLRKSPGFAIAAILTLALGMGANTVMFSVLNTVLLRPLEFPQPDRLAQIVATDARRGEVHGTVSAYDFLEWQKHSQSFSAMATISYNPLALTGLKTPVRISGQFVSAGFFDVFQVSALKGRTFLPGEDAPGKPRLVVLSFGAWSRHFDRDPDIIGRSITLDDQGYTVIGVMPADFAFPNDFTDAWCVPGFTPDKAASRATHFLSAVGRLKAGASVEQAQSELNIIATNLNKQDGGVSGVRVIGLQDEMVGSVRRRLLVLWAAVLVVLLIACANVAGLLLARAVSRQREVAIRTALGGSRRRLLQQFLTESVLLATLGGVMGVILSYSAGRLLVKVSGNAVPRLRNLHLDGWVLGFAALACIVTGLLFGIAPALHSLRLDLNASLKESGAETHSSSRVNLRSLFVMAELALAMVLLIAGGLLTETLWRLQHVDAGFMAENVLTFRFSVPQVRYPDSQRGELYQRVAERLAQLPGVDSVGATNDLPFAGSRSGSSFDIDGRPPDPTMLFHADYRTVSPDYFQTMRMRLLEGREFTVHDNRESPFVAVVNQAFAKKFFPNEDPLGHRVKSHGNLYEIVGVVGNVKHESLAIPAYPELYLCYLQADLQPWTFFVVRGRSKVEALTASVRNAVKEIAPDEPIYRVYPMKVLVEGSTSAQRFSTLLLAIFAALAVLLAAIGIYGVIAYSVVQRTREIGIRMALGAEPGDVLRLVLGQGVRIGLAGVVAGSLAAYIATRALAGMLFGVDPHDPLVFSGVAASIALVVVLASYIPARRATRVDPLVALRYE